MNATLYRDENYGAVALLWLPGGQLGLVEHGTFAALEGVLEALSEGADLTRAAFGGRSVWTLREHVEVTLARVRSWMQRAGFTDDPLAARAILSVPEGQAPDLPRPGSVALSEEVRARCQGILERIRRAAGASLEEAVYAFPRRLLDRRERPLPFLRFGLLAEARAPEALERAVRRELADLGPALVRATAILAPAGPSGAPRALVEVAFAPPRALLEAWQGRALPAFQDAPGSTRAVRFGLGVPLTPEALQSLAERAKRANAATLLETRDGSLLALVPAEVPGDPLADPALRARTAWLAEELEAWVPELEEVSDLLPRDRGVPL